MEPREQGGKVEAGAAGDDELAVEGERTLREREQRLDDLREVAGERALVAAAQVDLAAVAKDEAAEAVPLRLVYGAVERELAREPGEHRRDRRGDRQRHGAVISLYVRVTRAAEICET